MARIKFAHGVFCLSIFPGNAYMTIYIFSAAYLECLKSRCTSFIKAQGCDRNEYIYPKRSKCLFSKGTCLIFGSFLEFVKPISRSSPAEVL